MKCDIVIPVWNHPEYTSDCINSIIKNTRYPFRLILIDNGSDAKTQKYLESLLHRSDLEIKLMRNEKNLGFIKAVNQGLKESSSSYVCVLNNDTLVTDGWLGEMITVADSNQDIGLVNPSSNNLGQDPASISMDKFADSIKNLSGQFIEMGACLGFCMLIKKEIFEKIGFLDEIYGVGNFDDTDYSRRAANAGFSCVRAKASYVYHRVSSSFAKNKNFEEIFKKNRTIFEKKWGRPKRLLYVITKDHRKLLDWIKIETLKKARFGNWVWVFLKEKSKFQMREHSNVKIFYLPQLFFRQNCAYRILKRKKKFNSIYVDEERFLKNLNRLKRFHTSNIMLMGG